MQLARMNARFIIVWLVDENEHRRNLGSISCHERLKVLAWLTKGYYINDFRRYSKYENESSAKIERCNKKNRLTPLQKMLFNRPIYSASNNLTNLSYTDLADPYYEVMPKSRQINEDFTPMPQEHQNLEKHNDITKHFDSLSLSKLFAMYYQPMYQK